MADNDGIARSNEAWVTYHISPKDPVLREEVFCTDHPIADHAAIDFAEDGSVITPGVRLYQRMSHRLDPAELIRDGYPERKMEPDDTFKHIQVSARIVTHTLDSHVKLRWETAKPDYTHEHNGKYPISSFPRQDIR